MPANLILDSYRKGRTLARRVRRAMREPMLPIQAELQRPWLRHYGFGSVIDVGANVGQFASWARAAFPDAFIYSFEPLPTCYRELRSRFAEDRRFEAYEAAVGEAAGKATIYQNEFSPSSSMLAMKEAHQTAFPFAVDASPLSIDVRTLDDTFASVELAAPVLLKVDVQGYELRVLAGAQHTLRSCKLVLLELSLEGLYENEPLFDEVYRTMYSYGFELRGIIDTLRRPSDEMPLQVDAVFGVR